jgi:hypothetical protein
MTDNRGINIKALVLGVLTDVGGSLIVGSALAVIISIILVAQGVPENKLDAHLQGPIILVLSLIIGFGFTILGGFVAGRVSRKSEMMHGGIVGFIGLFFGLLFWASLPLWYNVLSLLAVVPLGMLGGRLAVGQSALIHPSTGN